MIGDGVGSWYVDIEHSQPFPSAADVCYLVAYPILAAGLFLLIRGRRPRRDIAGLLDSATVTAGLGVLSWVLLARPTMAASEHSFAAAAVGLAYPMADILLVGLLIRLVTTPGGRTPALRMLLAAVAMLIAADTTSAAVSLFTSTSTNALDTVWLSSYLLWGAAALHPSMYSLSQPTRTTEVDFSRARLVALTLATLIAPGTLAVQWLLGIKIDVWAVVTGSVVMFLLVVARMQVAIEQIVAANRDRDRLQEDLAYQAEHDSLTALPNRAQSLRLIEGALQRAQRSGAMIGLLFVDLDGFKAVNDNFGHRAGDDVLRCVAQRMQTVVRGGDIVGRLGGDEFVVLLETLDTERSAVEIADRLIEAVSAPITRSDGRLVRVGASVGVAISQDGATNPAHLLHEADTAVYRAKAAGRGRVEVFDNALRRELSERASFETAIIQAIGNDELLLHYQPIIDLRTGQVEGYEALVRWERPGFGLVSPAEFIPAAEASDLICDLDSWVLNHATRQLAAWSDIPGADRLTIAVNISGRHISNPRIKDDVNAALQACGLPPQRLILEITETVLIDDLLAIHHLEELRKLGVAISIDDFGTGYNSISRLQRLPVDIIKIDRSFLDTTEPSSNKLLQLMVQSVHAFGLPVIAEGVEYEYQLAALEAMECESAQGFYIGYPMPAADAERYLARSRSGR